MALLRTLKSIGAGRSRAAGFTLVELLLSMVIVGICMGAVYGVFRAGLDAWNYGTGESRLSFDCMYVLDSIGSDLRGAAYVQPNQPDGQEQSEPVFDGASDSMTFYTEAVKPGTSLWPGHRMRYYFEKPQPGEYGSLRLEDTPSAGAVPLVAKPYDEVILEHVVRFSLKYLSGNERRDKWEDPQGMPDAVEVELEVAGDDGRARRSFRVIVDLPARKADESS